MKSFVEENFVNLYSLVNGVLEYFDKNEIFIRDVDFVLFFKFKLLCKFEFGLRLNYFVEGDGLLCFKFLLLLKLLFFVYRVYGVNFGFVLLDCERVGF